MIRPVTLLVTLLLPVSGMAAATVEQRLQRVEQTLQNRSLLELLDRINQLQAEVSELRNQTETQSYQMRKLQKAQESLYLDIDRRLLQLERNGVAAATEAPLTSDTKTTANKPSSSATTVDAAAEQAAYSQAIEFLKVSDYAKAHASFSTYLHNFPEGRYAESAANWQAEASYMQRKYERAEEEYKALLKKYPNGSKNADAMLKLAYCHREQKAVLQAKKVAEELMERYPTSREAGIAKEMVAKIDAILQR